MKGYTTKTAIENYILQNIDSSFDSQIEAWIASVETIIDNATGRNFKADAEASPRVYDGPGRPELLIDECIEVTKVEVGNDSYGGSFSEVPQAGADRALFYPANHDSLGRPIYKVTLVSRTFSKGLQNQRITAKWGYSEEPPLDIQFAATVFMAGIINQSRSGGSEIKSESIGNYSVTYNSDAGQNSWADFDKAMQILEHYRKPII